MYRQSRHSKPKQTAREARRFSGARYGEQTPTSPGTSWQPVSSWYTEKVGESGHYYHQHVVIPGVLQLLALKETSSLLDLACGQGVLERRIPKPVEYLGIDLSPSLIRSAGQFTHNAKHTFMTGDVTQPLPTLKRDFTHAAIVLALQNIDHPELVVQQAADHLAPKGTLVLVFNHPCFRIPRQSSWGVDEAKKTQYRRIDRYSSPLKIPITATPSKGTHSEVTWSYHFSLGDFAEFLTKAGFAITKLEEWSSDKVSVGKAAKMENRSRSEFPLFLAIQARKM